MSLAWGLLEEQVTPLYLFLWRLLPWTCSGQHIVFKIMVMYIETPFIFTAEYYLMISYFAFYCCDKTLTKTNLGEESICLIAYSL